MSTEIKTNILFDEGSQYSFLTKDLTDTLFLQPIQRDDIYISLLGSKTPPTER